jgi:hypothetical protein
MVIQLHCRADSELFEVGGMDGDLRQRGIPGCACLKGIITVTYFQCKNDRFT